MLKAGWWQEATGVSLKFTYSIRERAAYLVPYRAAFADSLECRPHYAVAIPSQAPTT
jgi:hypothetical protein